MLFLMMYSLVLTTCSARSIGKVNRTRFTSVDRWNSDAFWIYNQLSPQQCLCTVLSKYNNVLLFNSYSNGSCQLFSSLPYTYTMEYHLNSTLILLSPLPPVNRAPCCSNLTWLMTRIQNSPLPVVSMTSPTYLAIDDLDYLAVISYGNALYRYNRTTMTMVSSIPIASTCTALSYYNKQYFVGCDKGSSAKLYVLSTATLSSITNISVPGDPRDVVFIRNGSVMIVCAEDIKQLVFYNVTSPTSYQVTSTLTAPYSPYGLYRVKDTLLHVAVFASNTPLYSLTYNDGIKNWTWNSTPETTSPPSAINFQSKLDACGRMWISVKGYGVRIFDSTGTISLYNWTLSTGLNGLALTKNFDFYISDFLGGKVYSYRPNILQCTS